MSGMLRLKDDEEFKRLLAKGNLRVHSDASAPHQREEKPARAPRQREVSKIEELLAIQITMVDNLPEPIREYPFLRGRAHRLDFAWPEWRINGWPIGVEVQGMVHRVKGRFSADLEKRALGLLQGWLILEVGGDQIRNGKAMEWIKELFQRATRRE